MLCSDDAVPCRADRGQSIWVGRGRPSKRPLSAAMRAKPLAATRAARVAKKKAFPAMGSVLSVFLPDVVLQRTKTNHDGFLYVYRP